MTDLPADPRNWNDDPVEGDAYLRPRSVSGGPRSSRPGAPEVPPKPVKVLPPDPVDTDPVEADPAPVVYDSLASLAPRSPARALVGPLLGVALVGVGLGFLLARTAGTSDANRTARTVVTPPPPLVATTARANVLGTNVQPAPVTTVAAPATTSAAPTSAVPTTASVTTVAPSTVPPVTAPPTTPAPVVTVSPAPAAISGVDVATPVRYAEFSGGKVFLHGRVPSAELRETIIRKVAAVVGPQNVFDDYVIDPATPPTAGGPLKVLDTIQFEPDSAVLRPAFTQILQLGVVLMNQNPAVRITVVGRSDARGSAEYNVELSQRRAAAVIAYFVGRGIEADRLTVEARGADDPLAPGADDASLQANRSVEFIVLGLID